MKKIVIFSDWFVPGFKAGGPIQSVYRMALLLSKNYEVYVVTSAYDLGNENIYENLEINKWLKLKDNLNVKYLNKEKINYNEIKLIINEFKKSTFVLNGIFSTYFSIIPLSLLKNSKNLFVFTRGMLHSSALSVKPFKKQLFIKISKILKLFKNVNFIATNLEEKSQILNFFSSNPIHILPNIPVEPVSYLEFKNLKTDEFSILFLGRISPEKNPLTLILALQNIEFRVHLTICGGTINNDYYGIIKKEIKKLPPNVKVTEINQLEHSQVLKLLNLQDLMILPSLGENFGHAIYESLSQGVPVIIGNNTPWNQIEYQKAGFIINPRDDKHLQKLIESYHNLSLEEQNNFKSNALGVAKKYYFENYFELEYQNVFG